MYPSKERKSIILTPSNYCNALNQPQCFLKRLRKDVYENDVFRNKHYCWGNPDFILRYWSKNGAMFFAKRYFSALSSNRNIALLRGMMLNNVLFEITICSLRQCKNVWHIAISTTSGLEMFDIPEIYTNKKEGLLSKSERRSFFCCKLDT